jgi:hypothetical protein
MKTGWRRLLREFWLRARRNDALPVPSRIWHFDSGSEELCQLLAKPRRSRLFRSIAILTFHLILILALQLRPEPDAKIKRFNRTPTAG